MAKDEKGQDRWFTFRNFKDQSNQALYKESFAQTIAEEILTTDLGDLVDRPIPEGHSMYIMQLSRSGGF